MVLIRGRKGIDLEPDEFTLVEIENYLLQIQGMLNVIEGMVNSNTDKK
jgi:hypothetical protein